MMERILCCCGWCAWPVGGGFDLVSGLCWALSEALDYGNIEGEQNILSPDLEQTLDFFTSADEGECQSAEAEGIEQDSGEAEDSAAAAAAASVSSTFLTSSSSASPAAAAAAAAASTMKTLSHVMDRCCPHISSTALSKQADFVSRTNCRKLVYDTLRLPVKTSSATPDVFRKPKSKTQPNEQYASNQATSYVKESPRGRKPYERPPLRMLEKKGTLQEQLDEERRHKEEERRLKEKTERELADIKRSHQSLEQKLKAARRKIEEDAEQFQRKDIEFELRLHQMQEELAEREARLNVQERQIAEFQEQERVRRRHVGQLTSQSRLPVAVRATAAGPAIARFVTPAPHVAIPQTAQPSVQPRLALAVVRATIGPTAPPPPVRPSTVRGISNRSTEPTVAHPLPTAPPMHRCHGGSGNSFQRIRLIKRRYY